MGSLKVKTIRRHNYGGKAREINEAYFVDHPKHAAFLVAIKRVVKVDPEAEAKAEADKAEQLARRREQDARRRAESKKKQARYERKDVQSAPKNKKSGRK